MRHWRNNVNATMHGVQEEATCAANAGFELAVQLFRDIRSGTRSVSEIAFDRLKELVRFCFSYAFETGSSTWPRCRNSIRARTLPYAQLPGQEENWMVKRGLWLVYDLYFHLQLHTNVRSLSRKILVDALHFASGLCHEYEIAASGLPIGSPSTLSWWQVAGDQALAFLVCMGWNTADRVITEAAINAMWDCYLRVVWMAHLRDQRWQEAIDETLD
jgi:hypothetical protein